MLRAVGDAKVAFAEREAQTLHASAVESARNDAAKIFSVSAATFEKDTLIAEADYQRVLGSWQAESLHEQQRRDAAVDEAYAAGAAEATYQVDVSAASAAQWQAIAAANPNDAYLQFRAAESSAMAAWFSQVSPFVAAYRGLSAAAWRQSGVDAKGLTAAYESDTALVQRNYAVSLAGDQRIAAVSAAMQQLGSATYAVENQSQLAIGTADAERAHAATAVRADTRYQTALIQIEHQFEQDHDGNARDDARKEARYRYDASLANADANWRNHVASLELAYASSEAARSYQAEVDQATWDRTRQIRRADAQYARTRALAAAQSDYWLGEAARAGLRRDQEAVLNADLWSAASAARVGAAAVLESTWNVPWASFERQRAVARQAAWSSIRDDYLAVQHDVGVAETEFDTLRANQYLASANEIAIVDLAHDAQQADLSANMAIAAADQQRAFAESLGREAESYRGLLAEAERVYDVAVAQATRDGTSIQPARDQRDAALQSAEDHYRAVYGQLSRTRREGVSQAGFQLTTGSNLLRLQRASAVADSQTAMNSALTQAYYDPANQSGLEAEQANLIRAFTSLQVAALTSSLAGMTSSPWADLANAEANARQTQIVDPLAELQANQRQLLAAARNDYHMAVTGAALTRSQGMDYGDALAGDMRAAGQFALVATFDDGELALPEAIEPPTPDLGYVARTTATVATTYPVIQEIDYYNHPGVYAYWGANLWWGTTYADVWWLWSSYNLNNYGWTGLNYSWIYGCFSGYHYGGACGGVYYGYWSYAPETFGWNGWSGAYVAPPTGLSPDFHVDVEQSVDGFGESVSALIAHATQTDEALAQPEDGRAPQLDGLNGTIQLGDTSTTFTSEQPIQTVGPDGLAEFTDSSNTQSWEAHAQGLATLTSEVLTRESQPMGDATASASDAVATAHDFNIRFRVRREGRAVFLEELRVGPPVFIERGIVGHSNRPAIEHLGSNLIGFVDQDGWVNFSGVVGHGRARLTAVTKAAGTWNSPKMTQVLRAAFAANPQLQSTKPQLQQLIDGVRSPYRLQETSNTIGIFIGGTFMHFYGVGNVERMYNQYRGTKFYYGGIGNAVDSLYPKLEGGFALSEFEGNLDYMTQDILRHGRGKEIHIFGWSRGAAQAAELARRLGGEGITVSFVGMFDPVYSVDRPGQSSSLIHRSTPGREGNYVTRDLAANIQTAVAIYAVNEVRSWFPATYFEPENGTATNIISIGSPGAHGEVGGHWQSNAFVQQLNYHVMMKYAEEHSSADFEFWDSNVPVTLDPQVQALYDACYTTFLGLKDTKKEFGEALKTFVNQQAESTMARLLKRVICVSGK